MSVQVTAAGAKATGVWIATCPFIVVSLLSGGTKLAGSQMHIVAGEFPMAVAPAILGVLATWVGWRRWLVVARGSASRVARSV